MLNVIVSSSGVMGIALGVFAVLGAPRLVGMEHGKWFPSEQAAVFALLLPALGRAAGWW